MVTLIFSKNRAMQLQATLESFYKHNSNEAPVVVLYNTTLTRDDYRHNNQYEELRARFPEVLFYHETSFARDVRDIISTSKHVCFVVDDCIFVDNFDLNSIADVLDANNILGFSLRLGKNITRSYTRKKEHGSPIFIKVVAAEANCCEYDWTTAPGSFDYPLELSSSVYRTEDILRILNIPGTPEITGPNILEAVMAGLSRHCFSSKKPYLACYETSVAFCNPVNRVQEVYPHMEAGTEHPYSIEDLADRFDNGEKIDVSAFDGFVPNATHVERELNFEKNIH